MAQVLQLRRGTSAQNDIFTGAVAEVSVDTDRDSLRVHDGTTMGGKEIAPLNVAIPQLPDATVVNGSDELIIQQSGVTKRATKTEVLAGIVNANVDANAAIAGTKLADDSITNAKIKSDAAIAGTKLADDSITNAKIKSDAAIVYSKLDLDDSIVAGDLTADAVTTAKIDDDAVTTAKIDDDAVTTAKIDDDAVTTAKIDDDAVTTAKIDDDAVTTAKILDANVTPAKLSQPFTLGTSVASTSGTSIDFTGIPSWAKRIHIMFANVSVDAATSVIVQVGDGSVVNSGYLGSGVTTQDSGATIGTNRTDAFSLDATSTASALRSGIATLMSMGSNQWAFCYTGGRSDLGNAAQGGGFVTLSGTLDRIRITTVSGTGTFDAGTINISYEG